MPYDVVRKFEETIAKYAGSKYGVSVSSCTNAIFLCCRYLNVRWVHIPKHTYVGVGQSVKNAGGKVLWTEETWTGVYRLRPYDIYDSALRFRKNMYVKDSFYCISFHSKKHIPIGRGGMILVDDREAYDWLKKARYDGRSEKALAEDNIAQEGWNMYLQAEQAARGLVLFKALKDNDCMDIIETPDYPDLSKCEVFK